MLEQVALIERERQFDQLQQQDQHGGERDDRHHILKTNRESIGRHGGPLAEGQAGTGDEEREQDEAGGSRSQKVGAPAQAVIASGLVFVHVRDRGSG